MTTTDITTKPQGNRDMSMYMTFRQVSYPTHWYITQERQVIYWFRHSNSIKIVQSQSPTLVMDTLDYTEKENQLYHTT